MESGSEDELTTGSKDWEKMNEKLYKEGYREGITEGREKYLQKYADMAYEIVNPHHERIANLLKDILFDMIHKTVEGVEAQENNQSEVDKNKKAEEEEIERRKVLQQILKDCSSLLDNIPNTTLPDLAPFDEMLSQLKKGFDKDYETIQSKFEAVRKYDRSKI